MGKLGSHFFSGISSCLCLIHIDYIQSHLMIPGIAVKGTILFILFIHFKLLNSRRNLVFIHYLMRVFGVQSQGPLHGLDWTLQDTIGIERKFFLRVSESKRILPYLMLQTSLYSFDSTLSKFSQLLLLQPEHSLLIRGLEK